MRLLAIADDCSPTANEGPRLAKSGPVINGVGVGGHEDKGPTNHSAAVHGGAQTNKGVVGKKGKEKGKGPKLQNGPQNWFRIGLGHWDWRIPGSLHR